MVDMVDEVDEVDVMDAGSPFPPPLPPSTAPFDQPTRRRSRWLVAVAVATIAAGAVAGGVWFLTARDGGFDTEPIARTVNEINSDISLNEDLPTIADGDACLLDRAREYVEQAPAGSGADVVVDGPRTAVISRLGRESDPIVHDCSLNIQPVEAFAGVFVMIAPTGNYPEYVRRALNDVGVVAIAGQSAHDGGTITSYCLDGEFSSDLCGADWVDDHIAVGVYGTMFSAVEAVTWLRTVLPDVIAELETLTPADFRLVETSGE
jgi:hypothetical protein